MARNAKTEKQAYTEPSDVSLEDQTLILPAKPMPWYIKLIRAFHLTKDQGIYVGIFLFVVIGIAITQATRHWQGIPAKAGTNTVKITIQPATASMPPNTTFQVWETADNPVAFTTVRIVFDPKLVKMIREVSTGPSPLTRVIKQTAMSEANTTGIINLTLGLDPTKRTTPQTGTFELATIPLAANTTTQNLSAGLHLNTPAMQVVNRDATLFTITTVDSTITLNPPPTPTPTPIPTNTPSMPTPTRAPTPTAVPTTIPLPTPTPLRTPTPSTPFVMTNVRATGITQTTATINWNLSDYGTGQVQYGIATTYGMFSIPETSFTWNYHVQALSKLIPNTLYHYRALSTDRYGHNNVSGDHTFTTLALNQTPVPTPTLTPTATPAPPHHWWSDWGKWWRRLWRR